MNAQVSDFGDGRMDSAIFLGKQSLRLVAGGGVGLPDASSAFVFGAGAWGGCSTSCGDGEQVDSDRRSPLPPPRLVSSQA
jgi:hypothetical protein